MESAPKFDLKSIKESLAGKIISNSLRYRLHSKVKDSLVRVVIETE